MIHSTGKFRVVIVAATVALAACSSATSGRRVAELSPQEKARADSAMWPYTQADVDFMWNMIHHHAQALVMARLAPTNDAGRDVRVLCERVINAQTDEIAIMTQWLRERNKPVPTPDPSGKRMMMNGVEHEMQMTGMLTESQMNELTAARGKEFDRTFLQMMIQHHQGAVAMVQELLSARGAAIDETVFKVASDIHVDQETEIRRMQTMLFNMLVKPEQ
ncbi:MAG: DUF305 domain-containing protein [Gemmatimonadota bacterium]